MDDINMLWMNIVFGLDLWIRGFDRRKFDDLMLGEHGCISSWYHIFGSEDLMDPSCSYDNLELLSLLLIFFGL